MLAALAPCVALAQATATAPASAAPPTATEPKAASEAGLSDLNQVLFEIRLGPTVISDTFSAYQVGRQTFLPLGELARLLTIAIRTHPVQGRANGFILKEDRPFALDLASATVTISERQLSFDPSLVRQRGDDLYVDSTLLSRWLPVDLQIDLSALALTVTPREPLPLQLRLAREAAAGQVGIGAAAESAFPQRELPYALASVPMIDQTIGATLARSGGNSQTDLSYSTFMTADLAGMQSTLYLTGSSNARSSDSRLTLSRHDPSGNLLGPLNARMVALGSVTVPGVSLVSRTFATGNGFAISNLPENRASGFDRHTFQGDLPPGWDVELYFNEALVGFQQSRPDGKYVFEDRPLSVGANQFRLVFHGPQGQLRIERQNFLLGEAQTASGQVYYQAAAHQDKTGNRHAVVQGEWGVTRQLSLNGALIRNHSARDDQSYGKVGLLAYAGPVIASVDVASQQGHGRLIDVGLKTRIGNISIQHNHTTVNDFTSDLLPGGADPLRMRDHLRIDGVLPVQALQRMPITFDVTRNRLASGLVGTEASLLTATYLNTVSVSHQLQWQSIAGASMLGGSVQLGRTFGELGVRGQANYALRPQRKLSSLGLALDRQLSDAYRVGLDVVRQVDNPETHFTANLTKSVGNYGLSVALGHSTRGTLTIGAQLFIAIGREPRHATWMISAQPMGNSGAASARVFVDTNMNGVLDPGETPVKDAGFNINGVLYPMRTDANGVAYLPQLPVHVPTDLSVSAATLDDPQWTSMPRGVRIVARPGHVAELEFPLVVTSEIDGTVYLAGPTGRRGIGEVELELVDAKGNVAAQGKSASDGFYIVPFVMPGTYQLRIAPGQLKQLGLRTDGGRTIQITADGKFVNGQDFVVSEAAK
jgi:hypothetical protein